MFIKESNTDMVRRGKVCSQSGEYCLQRRGREHGNKRRMVPEWRRMVTEKRKEGTERRGEECSQGGNECIQRRGKRAWMEV